MCLLAFVVLFHATLFGTIRGLGPEACLHAACNTPTGRLYDNIGRLQDVLDCVLVVAVALSARRIGVCRKGRQLDRKMLVVNNLFRLLGLGLPWTLGRRLERPAVLDGPLDFENPGRRSERESATTRIKAVK